MPPAFLTRGARGAVLPLAFHWDSNEVKRLLWIAKVSHISSFSFACIFCSYSSFSRTRFHFLRTLNNVYLGRFGLASVFLVTWTLSCEKSNASRPDGEVFSFSMSGKFSISR